MKDEQMSLMPSEDGSHLIFVRQLPIIEERLAEMSESIRARAKAATALACSPETVKAVKEARAALNKEFGEFEAARKAAKQRIMEPYEQFEEHYRRYIADVFRDADAELKRKIESVEDTLRSEREQAVRKYYGELLAAYGLDPGEWGFERTGIRVTKSASSKALKSAMDDFADKLRSDLEAISELDNADEVLAEYKLCMSLSAAQIRVSDRKAREEAARAERERLRYREEQDREAAAKVEAAVPEAMEIAREVKAEEVFELRFTVRAEKSKLKALKQFLDEGGFDYE